MRFRRLIAAAFPLLAVSSCVSSFSDYNSFNPTRLVLTCYPDDGRHGSAYCRTPTLGSRVGTWDETRFRFNFLIEQDGWRITGPARGVIEAGQEVFSVEAKGRTANSIDCQWHAKGSHRIGGPGGWVSGHCWAPAAQN